MFQIEQCPEVYVDACVRNEASQLVFMSAFGRDTATKELMARIQLAKGTHGLSELCLKGHGEHQGQSHTIFITDPGALDKVTGRLPKGLFGELTHLWIFQPSIRAPDKGAKQAWLIANLARSQETERVMRERIWVAVCELASVPLLAHWQTPVLEAIWSDMVFEMGHCGTASGYSPRFSEPLGKVVAYRVALTDDFAERVSRLIQQGTLTLQVPSQVQLAAVA